jgi:thymidylate synthase (FAD)
MKRIEIRVLNPDVLGDAEKMMVCAARLTQRGHQIGTMADFIALYEKDYKEETAEAMAALPHPTIQKFGVINVVVVGASRRFLAQITRHQNEVKFMSASLQYSDYSGAADFVVPYDILAKGPSFVERYLTSNELAMQAYADAINDGVDNDAAGYMAPQGLRNILIISATPYQWKHMITQRTCRRNTAETRYVMLRIWEHLFKLCPSMFEDAGPFCVKGECPEGKMSCGKAIWRTRATPAEIIADDFPLLKEVESNA